MLLKHSFLAIAFLATAAHAAAPSGSAPPSAGHRAEASYRAAIRPEVVAPSDPEAIARGSVILYGRLVSPPYKVSIQGDALTLNGVRIDPPQVPPWKQQVPMLQVSARAQELSRLASRIRSRYGEMASGSRARPLGELPALIAREESMVRTVEWSGSSKLHVVTAAGEEFSVDLAPHPPASEYPRIRAEYLQMTSERYRAELESGALLVVGCGAVLTVPPRYLDETRAGIEEGLKTGSHATLAKALLHDELVREILFLRAGSGNRGSEP